MKCPVLVLEGEALSSICHVSKLSITSKTKADNAYYIRAFQDDISAPELGSRDDGTTIDVQDLFLNMPVRAKFLKSVATELSYCYDIVLHYALIHPDKDFIFINNNKELINTSGITDQKSLLIHFLVKIYLVN